MKHNYRLVALDLDGTLLTDDKEITTETKRQIQHVHEQGVHVIFATGRGFQTAEKYWKELGLTGPMVLVNGGEIWEGAGNLHERHFIAQKDLQKLYELAVDADVWFWGYSVESVTGRDEWTADMLERGWMKFGISSKDLTVHKEIWDEVSQWPSVEITQSTPFNMEVTKKGVTKAAGVQRVCELLGIEMSEVMAVGDSPNDLSLMKQAGLSVAMDNAVDEIKAVAHVVTATNEEDGVAQAIAKYVHV
ncbi:HAD family phosphatase [Bacillaceae bacterium SIJ1]|uniref:Cof-type HAD-IIB family hydrolase n=1 Tax=Litoribacterium kuwaitense TaxID=1398745 RepID=UPI0013EC1D26|nr:Cof-type HAD-IIB family hydrolase [Litoribacterium kuwaitense]NGP44974.1 HAD family phosphatase [Litoribacterium kuwaitense]